MITTTLKKQENKFQTALEYLGEYRGVKGAVIFDNEGLIIGKIEKEGFDGETFSPLILLMLNRAMQILNRLGEDQIESLVIRTKDSWITLNRMDCLVLVVNANNDTDELLRVRIGQAAEMIKSTLTNNYFALAK